MNTPPNDLHLTSYMKLSKCKIVKHLEKNREIWLSKMFRCDTICIWKNTKYFSSNGDAFGAHRSLLEGTKWLYGVPCIESASKSNSLPIVLSLWP